jgi:hypothetical protein
MYKLIGSFDKSNTAEVRVSTTNWKGRSVVDIRVWFKPEEGLDLIPSRKGITLDTNKLLTLIDILKGVTS